MGENVKVISLFSTPVVVINIERSFTKDEIDCFENIPIEKNKEKRMTKHQSVNFNLFDSHPDTLKDIKKFCEYYLKKYLEEIDGVNTDLAELRITQSWLNRTKPGESHNSHHHANSYLSGVLYIKCLPNDYIYLEKRTYRLFNNMHFPINKPTVWNAFNYAQDVTEGDLIIFPSWMPHYVRLNETKDKERISLAFNTFPIGEMGNDYSRLILR